jgi:oligoendopeptidase F
VRTLANTLSVPETMEIELTDTRTTERTGAEDVHWDLSDLYTDVEDPQLRIDVDEALRSATAFAERYRGAVAALGAADLADACAALEAVWLPLQRAMAYANLRHAVDTTAAPVGSLVAELTERAAAVGSTVLFFDLEWNAIDEHRAVALLDDPALGRYRHHLETVRARRPHQLTEDEERILTELAPTGAAAWSRLFTQLTSTIRVDREGRTESLDEALAVLHDPDRSRRETAQHAITTALEADVSTRAYILNTLLADKATHDRLRHHPDWLHSRNLANEADAAQVDALVEAVTGRYDLVARYYRMKGRVLGLDTLHEWDRYAPIDTGEDSRLGWEDARDLVLDAYRDFSPEMSEIAATFFQRSWIDAAVAPGKRGGAFASPVTPDVHPYIFVNFTGRPRDAMTLAHELGHGIHMRLSQSHSLFNTSTPLTTAETASIFGETVTLARLLDMEQDPSRRFGLVTRRLEDAFAAIFRQIVMNRFEHAVHTARREQGELSLEEINEHWMTTQRAMFAGSVALTDEYQTWWSYVPHFIAVPGYVYAYAFGNLLSLALYRRYEQEGQAFVPRYLEMLSAGGSIAPNELLGRLGVDLTDPGFWDAGLDVLADEVSRAEDLAEEMRSG